MTQLTVYVLDPTLARALRAQRLLTSSLKFEPNFKQDNPDDFEHDLSTKKGRKVARFDFDRLLPLTLTEEETCLGVELRQVALEKVNRQLFVAKPVDQAAASNTQLDLERIRLSDKYKVFRHLWLHGYCMVDGLKFGVDYLCYSQDPLRFHADLMVIIKSKETDLGPPIDWIALSAVANKAKKTLVVASVNTATNEVEYLKMLRIPVSLPLNQPSRSTLSKMTEVASGLSEEALMDATEE